MAKIVESLPIRSQLMRILLGDFDYDAMRKVDPVMAPLLFYLYISFVFFILLNMFLAIVNGDSSRALPSSHAYSKHTLYSCSLCLPLTLTRRARGALSCTRRAALCHVKSHESL